MTFSKGQEVGAYGEYLDRKMSPEALNKERKKQLLRVSQIRKRDVLVYAADISTGGSDVSISHSDILPISDQLSNLKGSSGLDLILETPGGLAEIVEQIVNLLRSKYESLAVIVPGAAMSAGTIMTMAADAGDVSTFPNSDNRYSYINRAVSALDLRPHSVRWKGARASCHVRRSTAASRHDQDRQ